jgi:stage II sporulation protein D
MNFQQFYRYLRARPALTAGGCLLVLLALGGLWLFPSRTPPERSPRTPTSRTAPRVAKPIPEIIRIGLRRPSRQPAVVLWLSAPARLRDAKTKATLATLPAEKPISLRARADWDMVACSAPGVSTARPDLRVEVGNAPARLRIPGRRSGGGLYLGALRFTQKAGVLTVVDEVALETYLAGVVPGEVPGSFAVEAQKALAVAARTYTASSLGKHAGDGFDLCDGTHCQMYLGWTPPVGAYARGAAAVRDTRGQVLWNGPELVRAFYSADCGGVTADPEDVPLRDKPAGALPYLRKVIDRPGSGGPDFCASSGHHNWTRVLSRAQLQAALNRDPDTQVGTLTGLAFTAYDASGRVKSVLLRGGIPSPLAAMPLGPLSRLTIPVERTVSGWEFRNAVGATVLKSTLVRVRHAVPEQYQFDGKGYGHGLGLCQIGANGMASPAYGCDYRRILDHYYPGATLGPLANPGRALAAVPRPNTP